MQNRYAGKCYECGARVGEGEGFVEKVGGKWETRCAGCASNDEPTIRIELKEGIENTAIAKPESFLGGEWFGTYRNACAHAGSRFWKNDSTGESGNLVTFDSLPRMVEELKSVGFRVSVAADVADALRARVAVAQADDASANDRIDDLDAKLALEGKAAFGYQREGTRWLAPRRGAILNDDMGLGKTMQSLMAIPESTPVVIVCPAIAKSVWLREIAKWRSDMNSVIVLEGRKSFRWPEPGEVIIVNYQILPATGGEDDAPAGIPRVTDAPAGCVLIADEAQAIKSNKARQTKRFRSMADRCRKAGGRVWLLTATAILNRPPELWALLIAAGVHTDAFSNWNRFKDLMGGRDGRFAIEWGKPAPAATELLRRVMLRRTKADVQPDLPGKIFSELTVDINRSTARICDQAAAILAAKGIDLEQANRETIMSNIRQIHFEEVSAARQALAIAKIPAMLKFIEQAEQNEEPLVVFSWHRAPIDALADRDGWAVITGDTPHAERGRIEDAFQAGSLKGIAGTIQAMGTAVTLTRAAQELFVDESYTPALNEQAQDRCVRIGQTRTVNITRLVANHRLDEGLAALIAGKELIIDGSVERARVIAAENTAAKLAAGAAAIDSLAETAADAAARQEQAEIERIARAAQTAADGRPAGVAGSRRPAFSAPEKWADGAVRRLAHLDHDRAAELNGVGFNRLDSEFGHSLAAQLAADGLTDAQWRAVIKLCRRYSRQIGECPAEAEPDEMPF